MRSFTHQLATLENVRPKLFSWNSCDPLNVVKTIYRNAVPLAYRRPRQAEGNRQRNNAACFFRDLVNV